MADPVSLAAIGMGTAAAGGATGVIESLFQGQAQSNMYKYQAGVAQVNAAVAKQDADYATAAGEVEAGNSGLRTRAEVGATKAGFGAGNVAGASTGRVIASETEIGQQNEATIRANAAKRAYGFQVKGAEDVAQAGAYDVAATTSKESGELGAVSSIIGGAGNVASKWLQYGQVFGSGNSPSTFSGSFPGTG